jgi:TRAP-type C4-dicarboxylate transport system substrate-binding protein
MTLLKKLTITAATALVATTYATATTQAADVTMRVGHLNPADPFESHSGAMTAIFKSLVESASGGAIEVKLFPNGQLGKDNEVIQQVRDGIVESTISSAGGIAQHYPLVGVFDIPFAFPNIAVANRVIDQRSAFGKKFTGGLEAKTGLKVLGMIDSGGFFAFSNSEHPIKTVDDMKGLKIRTMTLPTHKAMVDSLGAQMNPIPIIAFAKFDEVQKYLSITNHVITPYIWTVNKGFYDGLSAEHRNIVDWASEVATEAGRGVSRVIEASERGLPKLAQKMEVNVVSPAEQKKFADAAQPAVRALIEENLGAEGVDMLNAMMAAIAAAQ